MRLMCDTVLIAPSEPWHGSMGFMHWTTERAEEIGMKIYSNAKWLYKLIRTQIF